VGVAVRIAYDARTQQDQVEQFGNDYCDMSTPDFVAGLGFPFRAIEGERALMHNKYIVIDAGTPNGQVLTGSANFTDDSWALQENNIITLRSPRLAELYANDFQELWKDANIASSGLMDSGEATLQYAGGPAHVLVNFAPGEGEWIDDSLVEQIGRTREQVTLAFVVLTSGDILEALMALMDRNVPVEGLYDRTQMEGVMYQWLLVPDNHWKIDAFMRLVQYGQLIGKESKPYSPGNDHNFMHNKVMVLDEVTVTGSYNFSRHAQQNAENVLLIRSSALAATYRDYIHALMGKYGTERGRAAPTPPTPREAPPPPAPNT
jgi:phosphatidylserine/phosphatidylglycerophosphate/cardiolipin synthase-like enzyme